MKLVLYLVWYLDLGNWCPVYPVHVFGVWTSGWDSDGMACLICAGLAGGQSGPTYIHHSPHNAQKISRISTDLVRLDMYLLCIHKTKQPKRPGCLKNSSENHIWQWSCEMLESCNILYHDVLWEVISLFHYCFF